MEVEILEQLDKSNFDQDLQGEKIVGEFLNEIFYDSAFLDYRRVENKIEQFRGVDVVAYTENGDFINIDEKVQLTQLGNPTPSFAFEIQHLNRKKETVDGWLLKDNDTDYYLLGYFNEMNGNVKVLTNAEQIKEFEFVYVSKARIAQFLTQKGYNREFLRNESAKLKEVIDQGGELPSEYESRRTGYRRVLENGVNLFYTTYLVEKPLNVVIHRRHLDKLATLIVRYKDGNIEYVKN